MPVLRTPSLTFLAALPRRRWPCTRPGGFPTDAAQAWNQADWSSAGLCPRRAPSRRRWCTSTPRARAAGRASSPTTAGSSSRRTAPARYTRYDKVAWGQPVKTNNWAPDARWYGHRPALVGAVEGPAAEALIPKSAPPSRAIPTSTRRLLGVARPQLQLVRRLCAAAIPEAGIALPPTAVGKDWRVDARHLRPYPEPHRRPALARRPPRRHDRLGRGRRGQRAGPRRRHRYPPPGPEAAGPRPHRHRHHRLIYFLSFSDALGQGSPGSAPRILQTIATSVQAGDDPKETWWKQAAMQPLAAASPLRPRSLDDEGRSESHGPGHAVEVG